jgi:hypothetical protein
MKKKSLHIVHFESPEFRCDAVPPEAHGLRIQDRLKGRAMQGARTDQLWPSLGCSQSISR